MTSVQETSIIFVVNVYKFFEKLVRVDLSKPRLTAHYLLSQIHDFKLRNYGFDNIPPSLSRIRECQHRSHHHPHLGCYQTQTRGKG